MMKIKISLILPLAFVCLLSCSDDNEFDRSGTYIPSSEDIENDSLVDKNDSIQEETSLVENGDAIEASKRFFAWYKSNNSEFYGKQNNCVKVVDEFYEIDSSGVTTFADFLEASGFFSNSYIHTMKNEWFDNCAKQMISDKENDLRAEGPPPCVYEGDIFFLMQEEPTDASFEALDFKIRSDSNNWVKVFTGITTITWKQDSTDSFKWKIVEI